MQTWSISYTADKKKLRNRCWQQGKMNYNVTTCQAHFYDEENVEIGRMKLKPEQVAADAELNLWKHSVEVGVLEVEEACVEDLFDKLNKELGIREFDSKEGIKPNPKEPIRTISKLKPKIPTPVDKNEPTVLYDILYTRCQTAKMTKNWQDGLLKYHPTLKLAEFYDATGTLLHKKTMKTVVEGAVIDDAGGGSITIEISSKREEIAINTKSIANTTNASIRLFNILYTTDKHKKSKKWLDGRLEYDETTKLARFMDESTGDCFYKKIMAREVAVRANGEEFETGAYIIQIDHEIQDKENKENKINDVTCIDGSSSAKRVKSIVANGSVPLSGRSNAELLSLLKNKKPPPV